MTATTNMFVLGAAGTSGVQWGTIIVTLVTFLILLALLKKFAWGPLKDVMDKREHDINKDIDDAEQAKLNAQKLEEQNKQTLKETQDEVQKILEESKVQARKQHEEIIHEANIRANGMIETAQNEINSEKELEDFFRQKGGKFGLHHNTAYRKFRKMLSFLVHPAAPGDFLPDEQIYSIRKAVNQYLRMGVPYDKKSGRYTWIQREIKQHWPSAKTIYEMCARRRDVDRKTLLLLYLATEGEGEIRQEEQKSFAEHHRRMDLMLCECGMPVLNIHSPFDWLVIQAVRQENEDDFIGLRMERMIRKIYNEEKPAVYLTAEK